MDIANELVTLIALYPILHPHLIALISAIYCLPPATSRRLEYLEFFSQDLDSFNYSNYESLFHEDPLNISYHEAINGFYARLLSAVGDWQVPEEVIVGIRDALFIVSGAMEKEPTMHENPDIDVPPAAMYMIHASKLFYEESKKGYDFSFKSFEVDRFEISVFVLNRSAIARSILSNFNF